MSNIVLQAPEMLRLLWVIPLLFGACLYAALRRRQAVRRFVETALLRRNMIFGSPVRRGGKDALVLIATVLIVLALARPGWHAKPQPLLFRGREVVFLLDVSKSMLAEDLAPNRLERAKLAIQDCLERLGGDRVSLVAFAGTAVVKCPLTLDYGFLRTILEEISTDSVVRGGTMMGDAVRRTLSDLFHGPLDHCRDIILITDGEDHGSFPIEAAKLAGERGVRILAIGLGDDQQGSRIPVPEEKQTPPVPTGGGGFMGSVRQPRVSSATELMAGTRDRPTPGPDQDNPRAFLRYEGREVRTRLDADTLREMAKVTPGGQYFHVATGTIDLGAVYQQLVASAETKELGTQSTHQYEEEFQWFLAVALAALALEWIISERNRGWHRFRLALLKAAQKCLGAYMKKRLGSDAFGLESRLQAVLARDRLKAGLVARVLRQALWGVGWITLSLATHAESARQLVAQGNAAYRAGQYTNALALYQKAEVASPRSPEIDFDQGAARYQDGQYAQAAAAFEQAARRSLDTRFTSRSRYNLGNCFLREAEGQRAGDLTQALASCRKSIRCYQDALALHPDVKEAAENIEVALRFLKALQRQIRMQQEAQKKEAERARQNQEQSQPGHPTSGGQPSRAPAQSQPDATGSSSTQNANQAAPNGSSPRNPSQESSAGTSLGPSRVGSGRPSPARAPSAPGHVLEQLQRLQQQAARQFQGQIGQSHGFAFNFSFQPGQARGQNQSQTHERWKNEPDDILAEEKENREKRRRFLTKMVERLVDKDW